MASAWSWFNPFGIHSFGALTTGMLLAVFIYWVRDTAVSVNEETRDHDKIPGRAAVLSTILLLGIYGLVTVATQAFAGIGDKRRSGADGDLPLRGAGLLQGRGHRPGFAPSPGTAPGASSVAE
jgi:amino acid transporter